MEAASVIQTGYIGLHCFCPYGTDLAIPGHVGCFRHLLKHANGATARIEPCSILCARVARTTHLSIATRLFQSTPKLQFVALGLRSGDDKYWTVTRSSSGCRAEPVSDDATCLDQIRWYEKYTLGTIDITHSFPLLTLAIVQS